MSLLSWGKFQYEPATKYFDWSFAPLFKSEERFARQYLFGLPSEFLLTSSGSNKVQYLSGSIKCVLIQIISIDDSISKVSQKVYAFQLTLNLNNSLSLNKIFFFKKKKKTIFLSYIDTCSRLLNPCFKTGLISNSSATNFSVKVFERKKTFFPEEKLHKLKINPQFMRISIKPLRGLLSWVFFNQSFLKTFSGLTFLISKK